MHYLDWFSVNSQQEDDQICVPGTRHANRLQELQPVSHTKPCLEWCWHWKSTLTFFSNDERIPGENAKQCGRTRSRLAFEHNAFCSLPPWSADISLDSLMKPMREKVSTFIVIFFILRASQVSLCFKLCTTRTHLHHSRLYMVRALGFFVTVEHL